MQMTRKEQIEAAAKAYAEIKFQYPQFVENWEHFISGAEWADQNSLLDPISKEDIICIMLKSGIKPDTILNAQLEAKLAIAVDALEFYSHYNLAQEALEKIK